MSGASPLPGISSQTVLNGMSVDVEDWFQVGAFEHVIGRREWDGLDRRVEANCTAILQLFADANVKATFFTLGWVAERHPLMMRCIAEAGHESASHGWDHQRVFKLGEAAFGQDIARARDVLEQTSGSAVTGYRAPSFSIDARTPWAHEVLVRHGYTYSSSVAPIVHDHYGWREAPRFAFRPVAGSGMIEVPVTTAEVAGRRMAAGGGGFFRLLPYAVSRWAVERVNTREGRPAVFYFHPWEIDPGQPRRSDAPLRSRLRHYTNLAAMAGKLQRLLGAFNWGRMDAVVAAEAARLDAESVAK